MDRILDRLLDLARAEDALRRASRLDQERPGESPRLRAALSAMRHFVAVRLEQETEFRDGQSPPCCAFTRLIVMFCSSGLPSCSSAPICRSTSAGGALQAPAMRACRTDGFLSFVTDPFSLTDSSTSIPEMAAAVSSSRS